MQQGKKEQTPDFEYFCIYDSKVSHYREPMLAVNRHDMLRQIDQLFRDPKNSSNMLVQNAEDFSVFKVGEFCKKTGVITPCTFEHVANLHDIRSAVQRDYARQEYAANPVNAQQALLPT